ncbi:MAG: DUF2125 domain-containing protein [Rickettsiales bacterium]|nr:DUF2125 domain-containing protein [Rickettsiales bacterium]
MKKIIIIAVSTLVLLSSSYTGLWFYKANKFKKDIHGLSAENGHSVSVGDVQVFGFPLSKNVSIKDLKISKSDGQNITFKSLQIESSVFDSEINMKVTGPFIVHNAEGEGVIIEVNADTKSTIFTNGQKIVKIKTEGSGYKVSDESTNSLIFAVSGQGLETEVTFGQNIQYQDKSNAVKVTDKNDATIFEAESMATNIEFTDGLEEDLVKFDINLKNFSTNRGLSDLNKNIPLPLAANNAQEPVPADQQNNQVVQPTSKKNLVISGEVSLGSNSSASNAEVVTQNSNIRVPIAFTLKNLDFSSENYKFLVSGMISAEPSEKLPFGDLNIRVENFDNFSKEFDKAGASSQDSGKYMTMTEIIKQLGVINPESKDNVLAFNLKKIKGTDLSGIELNDISFLLIFSETLKTNPQFREAMAKRLQPNFDKLNLGDLNEAHIDVSKIDKNLNPVKSKQFYNMLKSAKALKIIKAAKAAQSAQAAVQ